ncbi:MAG: DNA alkylation repair protein [Bacteriovoracaceae bacterium]|jgi:3-methyladenine DNA glycosylase AlkC|nr:DNA alkylation repair protein [Bacteriovoracaceae bacterium]
MNPKEKDQISLMADLLKNIYNKKFVNNLSRDFKNTYPQFNAEKFRKLVFTKDWKNKELKERMRHIVLSLNEVLPKNFLKAIKIIEELSKNISCESFELMIFPDYIEVFGQNYWKESIQGLEEITSIASGEFAVRVFILKDSEKMMKKMLSWSMHSNYHVRRLASEGCRPRLPWAMALPEFKKDPSLILPILENLKSDPELYVRRSVANNINDISKDNPKIVLRLLKKWNKNRSREMQWLVRHALRTLEKSGDKEALLLLGFSPNVDIKANFFKLKNKKIKMGESLEFSLELNSMTKSSQAIVVDYIIHHMKANGKRSPKVFKWTKKKISENRPLELSKKHAIKLINTRKYYSGRHEIEIQVNGNIVASGHFHLSV